ncbi:MAG: hypothetical protein H6737_23720 [Alphaproteobacteria bacterium]|nr:hypothetical protein [Alphaproteobacteria bacterium]
MSDCGTGIETSGGATRLQLSNSTVSDNSGTGMRVGGTPALLGFDQNLFSGNGAFGVVLVGETLVPVAASGSTMSGNVGGGVRIDGGVATGVDLQPMGQPYVVSSTLSLAGANTIAMGTEIQFDAGAGLTLTSGSLAADGATFTSSAFPASPGDWLGITLGTGCIDAQTSIVDSVVSFGGANGFGNIRIDGCDARVESTFVSQSSTFGIHVNAASPVLLSNTFASNASGDLGP